MTVFAAPVFDATVLSDGKELFKGQGAANGWAKRLSDEIDVAVEVRKIGSGWALCATVDGVVCIWGIYGQRLMRVN